MNMHFNTTGLLSKKALAALLICLVLPIASVRADQPISSGTEIFHGYDIYATTIVKEGSIWKQWFAGWMTSSDLPWDRIYYSFSTDSGSSWSNPKLAFTIANVQVNDPTVLRLWDPANSRHYYLMYYTYYPSGFGDPTNYIAASTSLDGISWTHHGIIIGADNGIDTDGAWSPTAYAVDSLGSTVYLYFHNNHPDGRIFRTTLSTDLLGFDKSTTIQVTEVGNLRANPDVSRSADGTWWMFYNGPSVTSDNKGNFNTCKMYSDDGITWHESGHNPIQQYNTMTTCTPFINWMSDSTYQLWYGYGTPTFMDFSVFVQCFISKAEPVMDIVASSEALQVLEAANAIDKDPATFWCSTGYVGSAAHTEWIYLNLGQTRNISQLVLTPRFVAGTAMCFPVDFKIQSSTDNKLWMDIEGQSYTNYICTDTSGQVFTFNPIVSAQYLRLFATKLSADSYGNFYCQIAEMAAISTTIPMNSEGLSQMDEFTQLHNYPNPFNESTTIQYTIREESFVHLEVFDIRGRKLADLIDTPQSSGTYSLTWAAENNKGEKLESGLYFCKLTVDNKVCLRKMLLTRYMP